MKRSAKEDDSPSKKNKSTLDSFFNKKPEKVEKLNKKGKGKEKEVIESSKKKVAKKIINLEPIELSSDSEDEPIIMKSTLGTSSAITSKKPLPASASKSTKIIKSNSRSPIASTSKLSTAKPKKEETPTPLLAPSNKDNYFTSPAQKKVVIKNKSSLPLDTPLLDFSPSGVDTSDWEKGTVPYSFLANAFALIANTKSTLFKSLVLTNMIRTVIEISPESLHAVIMLTSNRISTVYDDKKLGIGGTILGTVIVEVGGVKRAIVSKMSRAMGDPGDVLFELKKSVRLLAQPKPLQCKKLYLELLSLCDVQGSGSIAIKTAKVKKLAVAASGEESRFLIRTLIGNLRTGAVKLTLLTAIAKAFCMTNGATTESDSKAADALLRKVWARHPNYEHILGVILATGFNSIDEEIPLALGIPLQPMLGTPTRSLQEIYTRLGDREFLAEFKMDGQRCQVHVARGGRPRGETGGTIYQPSGDNEAIIWVKLFSRHLLETTEAFPDLVKTLSILVGQNDFLHSFILDSEVCAISAITGEVRSFQELSYRSKKAVEVEDIVIRCGCYIFDLMYLNSEPLLQFSLRKRKELISLHFPSSLIPVDVSYATLQLIPSLSNVEPDAVQEFFKLSLAGKAEGLMIKLLDEAEIEQEEEDSNDSDEQKEVLQVSKGKKKILQSTYQPDVRTASWLKLKSDYLNNLGDSLDLVVVGGWNGSGRKSKFWSPLLLACWDADQELFVPVCKVMSGFTDVFYQALFDRYKPGAATTSTTPFESVDAGVLRPDIWFQPSEVWEIKGADFTLSPVYTAGLQFMGERGISVRFPRFIKIRNDKSIENATTAYQLSEMYRGQSENKGKERIVEEVEENQIEEIIL